MPAPPRRRLRPRFGRFIGTGAAVGILVGIGIARATADPAGYSARTTYGYMAIFCALVGALVAAVVAAVVAGRD
ncbi:MAG: hypothetical protein IPH03_03435 [Tetrasphaera sp.]|nr:hypothetical protein [Tetrasphaera sp.]